MRLIHSLSAITLAIPLAACGFVHDEKVIGPYRMVATDIDEEMALCYRLEDGGCVGRIDETVFAFGANAHFIVAKQHPRNDKTTTNYFILDIAKDAPLADPKVSVTGPMSESEFLARARTSTLPPFTKRFEELE
jgi:hypothetical protein